MLYALALFLHVAGAIGMFVGFALESVVITRFRRVSTVEDARTWISLFGGLRFAYGASLASILIAGAYMTSVAWGWTTAWIDVALISMVLLGVLGGVLTGVRMAAIDRAAGGAQAGPIPAALRQELNDPRTAISIHIRAAVTIGILFLMTVKPDVSGSLITIVVAAALGVASAAFSLRTRQPAASAWAARS